MKEYILLNIKEFGVFIYTMLLRIVKCKSWDDLFNPLMLCIGELSCGELKRRVFTTLQKSQE